MKRILGADDLKKGDLAEPGWYPAELSDYSEKAAKSGDGSLNCIFDTTIIDGPYKGVTIRQWLNEKGLEYNGAFWAALGIPKNEMGGYTLETELFKSLVKRAKYSIHVKRGKFEGRDTNEIDGFRPLEGA